MDLLKADGFDDAIIGLGRKKGSEDSLVYSYDECVNILMKRDEMDYESAVEFMEFNVVGAYVGKTTPIFVKIGEEFEYNLRLQNDGYGYTGCIVVDQLQYPTNRVESNPGFNCTTFKCRNFIEDWVTNTWKKLNLIIGPMKDTWSFYNARVALVAGSSYNDEEYVVVYERCEKSQ